MAALRELEVPVWVTAPEPNTWREVLAALDGAQHEFSLDGRRVAVQEYGASNPDLLAGLEARGARVTRVPVYQWALPDDLAPLEAGARAIVDRADRRRALHDRHAGRAPAAGGRDDWGFATPCAPACAAASSRRSDRRRQRRCGSRASSPTSNRPIPGWGFWCARPPSERARSARKAWEGPSGGPET